MTFNGLFGRLNKMFGGHCKLQTLWGLSNQGQNLQNKFRFTLKSTLHSWRGIEPLIFFLFSSIDLQNQIKLSYIDVVIEKTCRKKQGILIIKHVVIMETKGIKLGIH